jgi:hypothetical protein
VDESHASRSGIFELFCVQSSGCQDRQRYTGAGLAPIRYAINAGSAAAHRPPLDFKLIQSEQRLETRDLLFYFLGSLIVISNDSVRMLYEAQKSAG